MMGKIKDTETITIDMDGVTHTLYRDEILKNQKLSDIFLMFEQVRWEMATADYELRKLAHAKASMENTLQQVAVEYIKGKQTEQLTNETPND